MLARHISHQLVPDAEPDSFLVLARELPECPTAGRTHRSSVAKQIECSTCLHAQAAKPKPTSLHSGADAEANAPLERDAQPTDATAARA